MGGVGNGAADDAALADDGLGVDEERAVRRDEAGARVDEYTGAERDGVRA